MKLGKRGPWQSRPPARPARLQREGPPAWEGASCAGRLPRASARSLPSPPGTSWPALGGCGSISGCGFRQALVDHYSKLSAEAARREQKALWKIQRHRLAGARLRFLVEDRKHIQVSRGFRWELFPGSGGSNLRLHADLCSGGGVVALVSCHEQSAAQASRRLHAQRFWAVGEGAEASGRLSGLGGHSGRHIPRWLDFRRC